MADVVVRWLDGGEVRTGGLETLDAARRRPPLWVDVTSADEATLGTLAAAFELHPLAVEDVLHEQQRPKIDTYAGHLFLVWTVPLAVHGRLHYAEIDIFLGEDFIVTCHAEKLDAVDAVAVGAAEHLGKGPAWVLHALVDHATDCVLPLVDGIGEQLDTLEDALMERARPEDLRRLQTSRRKLRAVHRVLGPERDVLRALVRESAYVSEDAYRYFQDVGDHLARAEDAVDTQRDIAASAMDIYLSSVSNRLNLVMKRLTIVTAVFLPGTLIAGIYGMNFRVMPELGLDFGYPAALALIVIVTVGMLYWFKRSEWW